jgi:hypothetical protein
MNIVAAVNVGDGVRPFSCVRSCGLQAAYFCGGEASRFPRRHKHTSSLDWHGCELCTHHAQLNPWFMHSRVLQAAEERG